MNDTFKLKSACRLWGVYPSAGGARGCAHLHWVPRTVPDQGEGCGSGLRRHRTTGRDARFHGRPDSCRYRGRCADAPICLMAGILNWTGGQVCDTMLRSAVRR